jgi:hypothetical protein
MFFEKKTPLNLRQELSQGPSLLAPVGVTISFIAPIGWQPANQSKLGPLGPQRRAGEASPKF